MAYRLPSTIGRTTRITGPFPLRLRFFVVRPLSASTESVITQCFRQAQCLYHNRIQLPRNFSYHQMRQQRHKSDGHIFGRSKRTARESFVLLWKDGPWSTSLLVVLIFMSAGFLLYTNYYYKTYIIGRFINYPEEVAKPLRKALWYTNIDLKPRLALKHYVQALKIAEEINFDRFSAEMIGVRIMVAQLFEKIQEYHKAIDVLELLRVDNIKWLEVVGFQEGWEGRRTTVLKMTVGVLSKLGELYSNEYVMEPELAEERLSWAIDMALKEQQRREREGTKEGEGEWMTPDEIGASLEALAHVFEKKNKHYLCAPLFLQALALASPRTCHTAILMNNLSISLAQQLPPPNYPQPPTREVLISNATAWAEKAIAAAAQVQPSERTEECDMGCAVATHNLGELAEMSDRLDVARERYEEAARLATVLGFKEGVKNAKMGLDRVDKAEKEREEKRKV